MSDRGERQSLLLPILIPVGGLAVIVLVLFLFSRVLLSVKPNAATAVALVVAAGIMTVAAFVASRRSVTGATLGSFVGAAAGIAMAAGGIAIVVIGPPEEEIPPFHAVLAAPEGAVPRASRPNALAFEAGGPIELEFDEPGPAIGHNVQIFDGPDDAAPAPLRRARHHRTGRDRLPDRTARARGVLLQLPAPSRHGMTGTVTVTEGAGGVTVVAQNTAFDTDEIHLPADTPSKLTLDNQDAFAHNLSIYEDDTASGVPLFTFEPFAGPATKTRDVRPLAEGEYYFRCDIHPTMEGTVVVAPAPPPGEGGPGSEPGEPSGDDEGG